MPKLLLPPQFGQVVQLFLDVKNDVFARITEPSNNDYDNDVNDNCDNNFGTFADFGVKNDQKVSHNMILMSKYKGQHGGKKGQKNSGKALPPHFSGNARKKSIFLCELFPNMYVAALLQKKNWEKTSLNLIKIKHPLQ